MWSVTVNFDLTERGCMMNSAGESKKTNTWSMQLDVVSINLCHFMDNHKLEAVTLQEITGKESVQAVYKWIWGEGYPSIDSFYLICSEFADEGVHIEDFLRKDGIPLQVDEATAKWTKVRVARLEKEKAATAKQVDKKNANLKMARIK